MARDLARYPPLGFKDLNVEKTAMSERYRSPAPMRELWLEYHEIGRQSGGLPAGAQVRFDRTDQAAVTVSHSQGVEG